MFPFKETGTFPEALKFDVLLLPESLEFLNHFTDKEKQKIYRCIDVSRRTAKPKFVKKLNGDIYSFRITINAKRIRFLAFKQKAKRTIPKLVITHGFIKKTRQIPLNELAKAVKIRNKYYSEL